MDLSGINVQILHLPRLVMIDNRERLEQLHALYKIALAIDNLDLISAQQALFFNIMAGYLV